MAVSCLLHRASTSLPALRYRGTDWQYSTDSTDWQHSCRPFLSQWLTHHLWSVQEWHIIGINTSNWRSRVLAPFTEARNTPLDNIMMAITGVSARKAQ